jgi:serine/threonine protein kinase
VLCDFSSSVVVGADGLEEAAAPAGTPAFMAPELKYGRRVGLACDVWSLGCLLLALLHGRLPQLLPDIEPDDAAASWNAAAVLDCVKEELGPLQLAFVTTCFTYDAAVRPGAHIMQLHDYMNTVPGLSPPRHNPAMLATFDALLGQLSAADETL